MRVRTQGTPHPPRHLLAMSPYFYLNELLVQVIRTLLGKQAGETPWSYPLGMYVCVYFPGGSTPIVSILTKKSSKFVTIFFLFDIRLICTYNLGIKTS
jgi:hypothetical protein